MLTIARSCVPLARALKWNERGMDLQDAIRQLLIEKQRLQVVIVELERLQIAADDADSPTESPVRKRRCVRKGIR